MIDIGSRTGHKLGILLVLTTLTIGSAAGASWLDPDSNEHDADVRLSVNASSVSSVKNVTWKATGPNDNVVYEGTGSGTNGNYSIIFDKGNDASGTHGDYEFEPQIYNTSDEIAETLSVKTITLDSKTPSVTFEDTSYVKSDPTISIDVSDDHTGVSNFSVTADNGATISDDGDFSSCDAGNTCTIDVQVDTSDLSSGDTFTLDVSATDDVGNNKSDASKDLTFDNSYDGDTSPEFEYDDDHIFELEDDSDDQTVDITLDGSDDEDTPVRITCYDGSDDQIDQTGYESIGGSGSSHTFSCELDADDYAGDSVDMYVEACDEAGNCGSDSDTYTYYMDLDAPSVTALEIPSEAEMFNSNFDVEFLATDDASGVEEVEYFFEEDTSEGDGTGFDWSSDQDTYEVDTGDLGEGDHTLYVRAKDEAGRWGDASTVDFSFDPDAVPEISLTVPESLSVTAGEEGSFDVTVENTGELHISSIEISASSGDIFSDSVSVSDIEPGESVTQGVTVNTDASNIGKHTIEVSTDNPSKTQELDLIVEANSNQQQEIDSELSDYESRLESLEANITELKQKVSEQRRQRLESNFSEFRQKVKDAKAAVDEGRYYEAESILEGIGQDYSAAESSYTQVQEEHRSAQFRMYLMLGIGGLILVGGGAIGFLSYSDEFDFEVDAEKLKEIEFDASSLGEIPEKIKGLLDREPEADEFEWDGFKNQ